MIVIMSFYIFMYIAVFVILKIGKYCNYLKYFVLLSIIIWSPMLFGYGKNFIYGWNTENPEHIISDNIQYELLYRPKNAKYAKPTAIVFKDSKWNSRINCIHRNNIYIICDIAHKINKIEGYNISRNNQPEIIIYKIHYNNNKEEKTIELSYYEVNEYSLGMDITRIIFILTYLSFGYIFIKSKYLKKCKSS